MSCSTRTSANADSSSTSSSSRLASSMVTEMLTSDVVTTSIAVRQRSKTSKTRRRNPCAISMRVDVMSTTVMCRLQASAASGSSTRRAARDQRAAAVELAAVQDLDRNALRDRRQDRARVQHLRAEVGQLRRLFERQSRHDVRRLHDAGIGGHHPVHVGPDLNLAGVERRAQNRRRVIRSAAPERGGHAGRGRPDVAADDRRSGGRRRAARDARRRRPAVSVVSGSAQPNVSLVTTTFRASTQTAGSPAARHAASMIRLLSSSPNAATASRARGDASFSVPMACNRLRSSVASDAST